MPRRLYRSVRKTNAPLPASESDSDNANATHTAGLCPVYLHVCRQHRRLIQPGALPPALDAQWAERPLVARRRDGTLDLIGRAGDLSALTRWVLSFGGDVIVAEPGRLRQSVFAEARRILDRYEA